MEIQIYKEVKKMPGVKRVEDAVQRAISGKKSARTSPDAPREKQLKKQIKKAKGNSRPGILKYLGIK